MPEVRLVAEAADAGAGPAAEGDAALDGGAHEAGQDGRGFGERVGGRAVVFRLELATGEQPPDPGADGGQDVCQIVVTRWGRGVKDERPGARLAEDPVQHQRMEVDVQLETAAEALDHRDGAGLAVRDAESSRRARVEGEVSGHTRPAPRDTRCDPRPGRSAGDRAA
jgi:hypothetical protein